MAVNEGVPSHSGERADPFEDCIVAYVDILGFRTHVEHAKNDRKTFETLRDAVAKIDAQAHGIEEYRRLCNSPLPSPRVSLLPRTAVTMTAFSDCYLLSEKAPDDEGEISPWHLMAAAQALGSSLLAENILTRGAVVRGGASFHDRGRVAFGPAIIDAYELEQNVALYPRILVTDGVRDAICWEDQAFWGGELLLTDIDGWSFINVLTPPLSRWSVVTGGTARPDKSEFLRGVQTHLESNLEKSCHNARHLTKIRWLVHHFNLAAAEHGLAMNEGVETTEKALKNHGPK